MSVIDRAARAIADIFVAEGFDYQSTKAVVKEARRKAGLRAPKERRGAPARMSLDEELRFVDAAYAHGGQTGLMMQVLLETGTRVSEFTALRIEDVRLAERVVVVEAGKGGKRREIPLRPELARLLAMHVGKRRAGPLFLSRQRRKHAGPRVYTRQRIGQIVRDIARKARIEKRVYPHLLRHTMATRLLAIGMDIADVQKFLGHDDINATRIYAETSVAMLKRKFDSVTEESGRAIVDAVSARHGEIVAAYAADLLSGRAGQKH